MFLTCFRTLLYINPTKSLGILATPFGGFQRNPRISNPDKRTLSCEINLFIEEGEGEPNKYLYGSASNKPSILGCKDAFPHTKIARFSLLECLHAKITLPLL